MDEAKLARFCELKLLRDLLEEELGELREEIIAVYGGNAEIPVGDYTLKVIYQEKKQFIDQKLFDALPDPELWKHVSKPDSAKINALVRANVLSERLLEGTYQVTRVPYLYVQK